MITAPEVTSLTIAKLSANSIELTWDDVGENFYYLVEISKPRESSPWTSLGYVSTNRFFTSTLTPLTHYQMRVSVASEGFDPSGWVETEEFESFEQNAYTFETMTELTLNKKFIQEKFLNGNNQYVNFNSDVIMAALTNEDFQYSDAYSHISQMSNFIIKEDRYHEIQSSIESVCRDKDRMYLMEDHGVLYLFERYQNIVKVSNDKGQNWFAVKLLNDRVGYPLSNTVFYQNSTTSYVLGYDRIFYGRESSDTRWSSDEVRFSSDEITFAKIGDTLQLGFDVNIFGTLGRLPADVSTIAEAITANEDYVYVVARDKVRFIKTRQAPIDTDPLSPTFGEKIFEETVQNITGNPKAVCYKLDSVKGRVFALITGEVKVEKQDPRNPENIVDSLDKGVYILEDHDTGKWTRVFGNTEEERRRIEPGYTSMSCNDFEIFISSSNYKVLPDQFISDPETVAKYSEDGVTSAVKAEWTEQFIHDKHYLMMSFRSNESSDWKTWEPGRMDYYAEPFFSKCMRSNTRCWVDNSWKVVVVYSDVVHSYAIDSASEQSPQRRMNEKWSYGDCTVISPNIEFNNFTRYASGIILYKYSGELVGYYEFNYRVKDNVRVVWKPTEVLLKAFLQVQTREIPWTPDDDSGYNEPDLRPLINKMIPDSYLADENFDAFCRYYLQYLSDGYGTSYNNLVSLIKNKYPKEKHSWEWMWSEVYKRNIYLSKEKREEVSRFFETRKNDFYSTKGTEASYKFLFKLLYNEDVEIDIESNNSLEYDIIVESDNISEDLAGTTVYTASGRCNVTYIERHYNKGKLQWRVTIHNLVGRFITGQEIKSERSSFEGTIIQGVRGKDMSSNTIDYINRGRSYYVMKIKSALPTSRFRDDILRFVHPVGFGFIGITLLTVFINAGLSMKHVETIINTYKTYKWDSGLPSEYPDRVADLDSSGNIKLDPATGEPVYLEGPQKGQAFPLRPTYMTDNPGLVNGLNADVRRRPMSPLFDQSAVTFSNFRNLVDKRLKDDTGNPRDPSDPTQIKIGE